MSRCAYIYSPKLSEPSVRSFFSHLRAIGVVINHLGKSDPPRRWSGADDEAVRQILGGTDLTNWTFLRDADAGLRFSIELHRDTKWEHDTISLSGPEAKVWEIAEFLAQTMAHYLVIVGLPGGGKNQAWQVISLSSDCPETLKRQFAHVEPGDPPKGGKSVRMGGSGAGGAPPSAS